MIFADLQIVVQPGSLAARNYHNWQKLFGKIHALLLQIDDDGKNSRPFQLSYLTHVYYEISVEIAAQ